MNPKWTDDGYLYAAIFVLVTAIWLLWQAGHL